MMWMSYKLRPGIILAVVIGFIATGCATLYADRDAARSAIDQVRRTISQAEAAGKDSASIENANSYLGVAIKELNLCRPIPSMAASRQAMAVLGAAAAAPAPAPATELVERLVFENDVFFDFDKDELKPRSIEILGQILARLQGTPKLVVRLAGHTDWMGSDIYNEDLSKRRTLVVAQWLQDRGIARRRIFTQWFGEARPRATNDTREGRAQNRRTEIDLVLLP